MLFSPSPELVISLGASGDKQKPLGISVFATTRSPARCGCSSNHDVPSANSFTNDIPNTKYSSRPNITSGWSRLRHFLKVSIFLGSLLSLNPWIYRNLLPDDNFSES